MAPSSLPVLQNNIAEVEELQGELMEEDLVEHILSLLRDSQMEVGVRYFAGGMLAQLASRPEAWTLDDELRTTILEQLVCEGERGGVVGWVLATCFMSMFCLLVFI